MKLLKNKNFTIFLNLKYFNSFSKNKGYLKTIDRF